MENSETINKIVTDIKKTSKYNNVNSDIIIRIAQTELRKRRTIKEAIKATKRKLHQIGTAFLPRKIPYEKYLNLLKDSYNALKKDEFLSICRQLMKFQSSTNERLTLLDSFYKEILSDIQPINSVVDIASGLGPLAIPWMPLKAGTTYYAYDIFNDMIKFLNDFMIFTNVRGKAYSYDVVQSFPQSQADVAFLLKSIPCLLQIDKNIIQRCLKEIHCQFIVISFPVMSLGGKNKGMRENYESLFMNGINEKDFKIKRFEFSTELVFRIEKT